MTTKTILNIQECLARYGSYYAISKAIFPLEHRIVYHIYHESADNIRAISTRKRN